MENTTNPAKKHILNYGVLLGILSVLLGVIIYITDNFQNWIFSLIGLAILVIVITYSIKAFKKENHGLLSLTEAFKIGIGTAVIGGIIGAIWSFVLMNYIEPDLIDRILETQREQMFDENPNMTEAQAETAMAMAKKFSSPAISTAFALIGNLFFGFIISLFAGLIMKKEAI